MKATARASGFSPRAKPYGDRKVVRLHRPARLGLGEAGRAGVADDQLRQRFVTTAIVLRPDRSAARTSTRKGGFHSTPEIPPLIFSGDHAHVAQIGSIAGAFAVPRRSSQFAVAVAVPEKFTPASGVLRPRGQACDFTCAGAPRPGGNVHVQSSLRSRGAGNAGHARAAGPAPSAACAANSPGANARSSETWSPAMAICAIARPMASRPSCVTDAIVMRAGTVARKTTEARLGQPEVEHDCDALCGSLPRRRDRDLAPSQGVPDFRRVAGDAPVTRARRLVAAGWRRSRIPAVAAAVNVVELRVLPLSPQPGSGENRLDARGRGTSPSVAKPLSPGPSAYVGSGAVDRAPGSRFARARTSASAFSPGVGRCRAASWTRFEDGCVRRFDPFLQLRGSPGSSDRRRQHGARGNGSRAAISKFARGVDAREQRLGVQHINQTVGRTLPGNPGSNAVDVPGMPWRSAVTCVSAERGSPASRRSKANIDELALLEQRLTKQRAIGQPGGDCRQYVSPRDKLIPCGPSVIPGAMASAHGWCGCDRNASRRGRKIIAPSALRE